MNNFYVWLFLCVNLSTFSQIGINTTTPDPSSMLEINATNKGLLIPGVSLSDVTDTTLDGTNSAATSLLVYNTNASVTGGDGVGFYYFTGAIWEKISGSSNDSDFFEESTTTPPDDINDDMYTMGNVAIGKNTADYSLDIDAGASLYGVRLTLTGDNSSDDKIGYYGSIQNDNGTGDHHGSYNTISGNGNGNHYGSYNVLSGSGIGLQWAIRNSITNTGNGQHGGVHNTMSGIGSGDQIGNRNEITNSGNGAHYGSYNTISGNGTGTHYGNYTILSGNGNGIKYGSRIVLSGNGTGTQYGSYNEVTGSGNGEHYGNRNYLSGTGTGAKYGMHTSIPTSANGDLYGVYSNVLRTTGNSYAGYFQGKVTIGNTTSNTYTLPESRGTANQIMQTDGSGNVSWVDPSGGGSSDADFYEEGTSTAPDNINDDMYTMGNVAIGQNTADYPIDIYADGPVRAIRVTQFGAADNNDRMGYYGYLENFFGTGNHYGMVNEILSTDTGNTAAHHGIRNIVRGDGKGIMMGVRNDLTNSGHREHYGTYNALSGEGIGDHHGTYNLISGFGSGTKYGSYNELAGSGTGVQWATRNIISNTGNAQHAGTYSTLSGSSSGDQIGSRNEIINTSNGTHYGAYNDLSGNGTGVHYGNYNALSGSGNGTKYGTHNTLTGGGTGIQYGSYNEVTSSGNGEHYGSRNYLSGTGTGAKYAMHTSIPTSANGDLYGVYSSVLRTTGNSFAGYFLGKVAIGNTTSNTYTLPQTRGTANQIMQTDGSGNVSWVNLPPAPAPVSSPWTGSGPNTFNASGNLGINTASPAYDLEVGGTIMLEDSNTPLSATGHSGIYSSNGKLNAIDASGNTTVISPHHFELVEPSEEMAWSFYSKNKGLNKQVNVDMMKLTRLVERLSGEQLVHLADWNGDRINRKETAISKGDVELLQEENAVLREDVVKIREDNMALRKTLEQLTKKLEALEEIFQN